MLVIRRKPYLRMSNQIQILNTAIKTDKEGRNSLNYLHKASGGDNKHRPSIWAENQQTKDIAQKLSEAGIPALVMVKGGKAPGTYVCKQLVYTYAMWLSPEFHIQVVNAYDALANGRLEELRIETQRISDRNEARLESPVLTDAVKLVRESLGKEVSFFHYSAEFDMINRIVLGQSSKSYKEDHGLSKTDPIRDELTPLQISCVKYLQRNNAALIDIGMSFDDRKESLKKLFSTRFLPNLVKELTQIEG